MTESDSSVSIKDQMKKFVIKGLLGYQTVVAYHIGKKIGIIDFLYQKYHRDHQLDPTESLESAPADAIVQFNEQELETNLGLNHHYLDSWLQMAVVCGIFELDRTTQQLKTAPCVFALLVNYDFEFYMGDLVAGYTSFYLFQDDIIKSFKTGQVFDPLHPPAYISPSLYSDAQKMAAAEGKLIEDLFYNECRTTARALKNGGVMLDVGCGYGHTFRHWIKKYKAAHFTGVDPDVNAINSFRSFVQAKSWGDRVELVASGLIEFAKTNPKPFDVITMFQVLHEIPVNIRQPMFENLYALLKPGGLMLIAEHNVPDLSKTDPKTTNLFWVMHKWFEVAIGSHFYDEETFPMFIATTPFKQAELKKSSRAVVWLLRK